MAGGKGLRVTGKMVGEDARQHLNTMRDELNRQVLQGNAAVGEEILKRMHSEYNRAAETLGLPLKTMKAVSGWKIHKYIVSVTGEVFEIE